MFSNHNIKILSFFLDGEKRDVREGGYSSLKFNEQDNSLRASIEYGSGHGYILKVFPKVIFKKYEKNLKLDQFQIDFQMSDNTSSKEIKTAAIGGAVGFLALGPVGAAAGTLIGANVKQVPAVIIVPSDNVKIEVKVKASLINYLHELEFFGDK